MVAPDQPKLADRCTILPDQRLLAGHTLASTSDPSPDSDCADPLAHAGPAAACPADEPTPEAVPAKHNSYSSSNSKKYVSTTP
jgi:hypothetical protein